LCAAKVFRSAATPAPQEGSNPAMVSKIGGVLLVGLLNFYCLRARPENKNMPRHLEIAPDAPANKNVRGLLLRAQG
jgi:hypothetical protein